MPPGKTRRAVSSISRAGSGHRTSWCFSSPAAARRCCATISEINIVRKHLSAIKGGRLAARARPARLVTLAISDVPGDDPAVIGSGPTVPDPTTLADARAIIARYRLDLPPAVTRALADPANESPKPGDNAFAATSFALASRPADVFRE